MFKRVLKNAVALGAGQVILLLSQLLIPPAFIAAYGVDGYGTWLVLGSAVGYLTTLDFGFQTYFANELTTLYHRGDLVTFQRLQSVGLRLVLGLVSVGVALCILPFHLPLAGWVGISLPPIQAAWTLLFLALQILGAIVCGQLLGTFRAMGQAHQGVLIANSQKLILLFGTLGLAWMRVNFWEIALFQFATIGGAVGLTLQILWRCHPAVFPTLKYWNPALAREALGPSAFFGLFVVNQFLVFQAPVLILNRFLGAKAVVAFTVARTLFSFARQATGLLQTALAPELTRLKGIGDTVQLGRVYNLSESLVLPASLFLNTLVFLLSPSLLYAWLKRNDLFDANLFSAMMLVSILMSVKEFKLYFQYATNHHRKTALVTCAAYLLMLLVSLPAIMGFGVTGLLLAWVLSESVQIRWIHSFNRGLLEGHARLSFAPTIKLMVFSVLLAALLSSGVPLTNLSPGLRRGAGSLLVLFVAIAAYFLFDLQSFLRECKLRLRFGRTPGLGVPPPLLHVKTQD